MCNLQIIFIFTTSKMVQKVSNTQIFIAIVVVGLLITGAYFMGRKGVNPANENQQVVNRRMVMSSPPQMMSSRQHPVLAYQRSASLDRHPASLGDPIRPTIATGPTHNLYHELGGHDKKLAYPHLSTTGLMNSPSAGGGVVPVPRGSLKMTNEHYKFPFYYQSKPLKPYDYFKPYGPNQPGMQNDIVYADTPFYARADTAYSPPYTGTGSVPFIGSVSSYAPFAEVQTPWEKAGMLQTTDEQDNTILNLYRRPIAPLQDLFEYTVQDKNGFIIPLKTTFLEDGDIVRSVQGKESKGSWRANIYVNNKYVWV